MVHLQNIAVRKKLLAAVSKYSNELSKYFENFSYSGNKVIKNVFTNLPKINYFKGVFYNQSFEYFRNIFELIIKKYDDYSKTNLYI